MVVRNTVVALSGPRHQTSKVGQPAADAPSIVVDRIAKPAVDGPAIGGTSAWRQADAPVFG
jgi:hypothetical protein